MSRLGEIERNIVDPLKERPLLDAADAVLGADRSAIAVDPVEDHRLGGMKEPFDGLAPPDLPAARC